MKLSVTQWTNIQCGLPEQGKGSVLEALIEHRTFGKPWASDVAIALSKEQEALVREAARLVEDEYGGPKLRQRLGMEAEQQPGPAGEGP